MIHIWSYIRALSNVFNLVSQYDNCFFFFSEVAGIWLCWNMFGYRGYRYIETCILSVRSLYSPTILSQITAPRCGSGRKFRPNTGWDAHTLCPKYRECITPSRGEVTSRGHDFCLAEGCLESPSRLVCGFVVRTRRGACFLLSHFQMRHQGV